MKDYDINKKKVYIMGFSHGAYTVAGAVASFKNGFFSGVAPMACSVSLSNVKGTMVYLLIGSRDQVCGGVRGMNHTMNSAYRAGAKKVWLDVVNGGHGEALGNLDIDRVLKWFGWLKK